MNEKKEAFSYTYSSARQEEIRRIRDKYIPKEENKMEQLRRLDESAEKPGTIVSILVGIIGALLLGVGMCGTMVWTETMFIPGIIIGVIGIAGVSSAYPVYSHITKRQREKLTPEIRRLLSELEQ